MGTVPVDPNTSVGLSDLGNAEFECYQSGGTIYVGDLDQDAAGVAVAAGKSGCSLSYWDGKLWVAWTEPDGQLALASSTTGYNFGSPDPLPQYSDYAPAISPNGVGTSLDIAWRGLDTSNHLNIGVSNSNGTGFAYYELPDTSRYSPSITAFQGHLYLAWAGTGKKPTLNVVQFSNVPTYYCHQIYSQTAAFGPAIGWNTAHYYLFLAWVGTDSGHTLNVVPGPIDDTGCGAIPDKSLPLSFKGFTGGLGKDGNTGDFSDDILGANPHLIKVTYYPPFT